MSGCHPLKHRGFLALYMISGFNRSVPVEFTHKPTVIRSLLHLLPLIGPAQGIFHTMSDLMRMNLGFTYILTGGEGGRGSGLGKKTSLVEVEHIFRLEIPVFDYFRHGSSR